jgi:putative transposase
MSQYRRCYQSGGNYFFTLVTHQRRPIFANPEKVEQLKTAINKVKKKYPFSLNAIVVLPDHLHCIWRLPENDKDFSTRWRLIKRYFSMEMGTLINHRKEKEVWQRRFWEHIISRWREIKNGFCVGWIRCVFCIVIHNYWWITS